MTTLPVTTYFIYIVLTNKNVKIIISLADEHLKRYMTTLPVTTYFIYIVLTNKNVKINVEF
jgi:hypothetical protein